MNTLQFTAITSSGRAYDIEFPLHPQTRSPEAVSSLITDVLAAISTALEKGGDVSDGDVLQSLAMVLAIRARMVDAHPESAAALLKSLLDEAFNAVEEARTYQAARA